MSMRPLDRLPSIRAKLGVVIVFAVGMTVLLVYLLIGYALRNSVRDEDRLQLLEAARTAAEPGWPGPGMAPDGSPAEGAQFLVHNRPGWSGKPVTIGDVPLFDDEAVHVGTTAEGYDYAVVPILRDGAYRGSMYAVRRAPTGLFPSIGSTFGFLRDYWWQFLVGGAVAAGTALFMARLLALGMTRPLREMAHAAGKMAQGEYNQRIQTASRDEVGQLATAFNRMSGELESVEKLRRDLVANVSHELKTPISALRAHLENLLDGVEQPNRRTLEIMLQQSERLSRLVEQLLDLSRLESGEIPLDIREVDVRELIEDAVSEVGLARPHHLTVQAEVPADLPPVLADRERLHQVLFNLLDNAIRFTPPGGSVTVIANRTGGRCEVRVSDTGPGVAAEHLPLLFERFYRADAARARGDGGTGIGLAIARSVVEAHGGTIRAVSEMGHGTTFIFDLPLAPDSGRVHHPVSAHEPAGDSLTHVTTGGAN